MELKTYRQRTEYGILEKPCLVDSGIEDIFATLNQVIEDISVKIAEIEEFRVGYKETFDKAKIEAEKPENANNDAIQEAYDDAWLNLTAIDDRLEQMQELLERITNNR